MEQMDGVRLDGRTIRVNEAHEKRRTYSSRSNDQDRSRYSSRDGYGRNNHYSSGRGHYTEDRRRHGSSQSSYNSGNPW